MTSCYKDQKGDRLRPEYVPCLSQPLPGQKALPCCSLGHSCMSNGMCYCPNLVTGGSHYYLGGCTDASLQDGSCPNQCSSEYQTDSQWNPSTSQWQCCGRTPDGDLSCDHPTGANFTLPGPAQLYTLAVGVSNSYSAMPTGYVASVSASIASKYPSTTTSLSAHTTSTGQAPPTAKDSNTGAAASPAAATLSPGTTSAGPNASTTSSVSAGAIAGAVIGSLLGIALLVALIVLFCRNKRRRQGKAQTRWGEESQQSKSFGDPPSAETQGAMWPFKTSANSSRVAVVPQKVSELQSQSAGPTSTHVHELDSGSSGFVELPTRDRRLELPSH